MGSENDGAWYMIWVKLRQFKSSVFVFRAQHFYLTKPFTELFIKIILNVLSDLTNNIFIATFAPLNKIQI